MKNIHVIPTDQPSRLHLGNSGLVLCYLDFGENTINGQHIYVTSDEEIKEGVNQWYLDKFLNKPMNSGGAQYGEKQNVIILTTDLTLITDGVQAIDDEFLEWFVKNPTCEFVEVNKNLIVTQDKPLIQHQGSKPIVVPHRIDYKIIIPQEEPKQETLEEAAKKYKDLKLPDDLYDGFIVGAKWQSERMYSEEEVKDIVDKTIEKFYKHRYADRTKAEMKELWFKNFKKK
jgi:hypothetical protein